MSEPKKPPPGVVDQVQGDLRAVGGFFKSLWKGVERVNRGVDEARKDPEAPPRLDEKTAKKIRQAEDQFPSCPVCGGSGFVGERVQVACPECKKTKEKRT